MLYADSYLTKDEFYQMFDHKGYESLRGKYRCDDALPTIYDKLNRKARRWFYGNYELKFNNLLDDI